MPANKYALIRYRSIDNCLTNKYKTYPSKEDLRDACEEALFGTSEGNISIYTIDKDISAMRNDTVLGYEAPIAYSKEYNGYYYRDPQYSINKFPINEDGMEALNFAAHTLYQFRHQPIFKQFEEVISKIRDSLALQPDGLDQTYKDHMIFEENISVEGKNHLTPLLNAIKNNIYVAFEYKAFQADETKEYLFAPYLLKEYKKRWYVIGMDKDAGKIKTFGLERIVSLKISEDYFLKEEGFDPRVYFEHSIGIGHYGKTPKKIKLKVEKLQSKYMMSQPIHHSLKLVEEKKDHNILELEVILSHELVNEIMAWTPFVEVVSPKELRDLVVERLKNIQKKYRL
ncbi:MAG: putative DNA-binding transcriptional regulator YafY [Glaciecola sp.]|jgi:predicted DNA-binding transcriptional regulator YafY